MQAALEAFGDLLCNASCLRSAVLLQTLDTAVCSCHVLPQALGLPSMASEAPESHGGEADRLSQILQPFGFKQGEANKSGAAGGSYSSLYVSSIKQLQCVEGALPFSLPSTRPGDQPDVWSCS